MKVHRHILPVIVIAQFFCTSLWFAGNGVMKNLIFDFNLSNSALAHLTSAVQSGFILGTLIYAVLTLADRFSPSKVFFLSALFAATFNLGLIWGNNSLTSILIFRFLTGFFLAGIYPVGMKIAADYFEKGLGKALGYLVGALVIGTAFPHLLKEITNAYPWESVIFGTSILATLGAFLMFLFISDGPFRKAGQRLDFSVCFKVFQNQKFRLAALGYFGHMWELYAFWAFVPVIIETYNSNHLGAIDVSLFSFVIIGIGGIACVIGGYISETCGTKRTAYYALLFSCSCCLISPVIFNQQSEIVLLSFLVFWGIMVVADSPLFSTLVAQNTSPEMKGTALTIVNCIGFSITIISIQLLNVMNSSLLNAKYNFMLLALGPLFGFLALRSNRE